MIEKRRPSVKIFVIRGIARQARGENDAAISDFTRAIELDPGESWPYHNRATAFLARQEFDRALRDAEEAIKIDPSEAAHWANRASVHFAKKAFDPAISDYTEAISRLRGGEAVFEGERKPGHSSARLLAVKWTCALAECRIAKGETDKAVVDYSEATRLDPNDALSFNSFAWLLATSEDSRVRNGLKAFEVAARACDLTGYRNHLLLDTLAAAYAAAGDFDAAVRWQVDAITLGESDPGSVAKYRRRLSLFMKNQPFIEQASH